MSTQTETKSRDARGLIAEESFEFIVDGVLRNNEGMEREVAESIVEEALKFVYVCAKNTGDPMRPSRVVDEGWHSLILHTHTYQKLCSNLGRFVHHRPEKADRTRRDPEALKRTHDAIVAAGFTTQRDMWLAPDGGGINVAASCDHSPEPSCAACMDGGPNFA